MALEVQVLDQEMQTTPKAFVELGLTGLKTADGVVVEDFVPRLRNLKDRVRAYSEMTRDPVVGAILFAIEMYARQVTWYTEPGDDGRVNQEAADFVWEASQTMSHTWQDFMSEALSMLPYGFSIHEIVYERRSDGRVWWKKLPIRAQETISRWDFDSEQGLKGFWQTLEWGGGLTGFGLIPEVYIPIRKALLFRPSVNKSNPEGRSVLQSAYKPWYMKKKLEIIEAIGIERDLAGYPVLKAPIDVFGDSKLAMAQREYANNIVSRVRKDEQMGAILPPNWELTLLSAEGSSSVDTDRVINRYDARIAQAVLADVILMGHQSVGSYALAEVKTNIFNQALVAWMDAIEQVFNRYAVPRLMALNSFPGMTALPKFRHGPVANIEPMRLANILFRLITVGVIQVDEEVEKQLREVLGLPPKDHATVRLQEPKGGITNAGLRAAGGRGDNETRPNDPSGGEAS